MGTLTHWEEWMWRLEGCERGQEDWWERELCLKYKKKSEKQNNNLKRNLTLEGIIILKELGVNIFPFHCKHPSNILQQFNM